MGTGAEWSAVATEITAATTPWASQAVVRLFALAEEDGRIALRSFAKQMGDAALLDLIRGHVTAKLEAIVASEDPRGFFWRTVVRAAISWKRKGSSKVEAQPDRDETSVDGAGGEEEACATRHDFVAAWARLSPREQQILNAIADGEFPCSRFASPKQP